MSVRSKAPLVAALALAACAVGPNYHRPSAPVPQRFKEAEGWKPAQPKEAASGTNWWSVYDDAVLDGLEQQIDISNQTLKASEASWREAQAVVSAARAQLFPTVGVSGSATRTKGLGATLGGSTTTTTGGGTPAVVPSTSRAPSNTFDATANASWAIDIWGKIRRTIESDVANAQASEADLAAARLSAQGTLATDYVELRVSDEMKQLLDQTVEAYQRSLQITQNQYKAGIVAKADVITAETQLEGAQSQQISIGIMRSQLEHAIAVLVGKPPADFAIVPAVFGTTVPVAPSGVPSSLLERRPDVAAAERSMASANAQIGVAVAAYFPDLTLSGSYGFTNSVINGLIRAPNNVWSFGGTLSETVLDFGARSAQVRQARAAYDVAVANYRQAVLTAFQQVEDQLAALRILEQQDAVQERTVKSANEAVRLTLNEYKAGTVAYTAVVTAQATALADAQTLLTIRQNRLTASVALIQALGGGWQAAALKTAGVGAPASPGAT
ncbi:MAG TPA: efflux transporter outer membrane subunit [Steroidobacteraceae bacterium]|jgi:NodT family efflux transporter outer membrane factor (OMF) lipoprotein|nr:efflux transporter outer membrane subunit [Steroidobacteraceae bacterium]